MPQTSTIVAFLVVGFVVYITVQGQLPQYKAAVFGGANATATTSTSAPSGGGSSLAATPS